VSLCCYLLFVVCSSKSMSVRGRQRMTTTYKIIQGEFDIFAQNN
jgi:hypothetical protein